MQMCVLILEIIRSWFSHILFNWIVLKANINKKQRTGILWLLQYWNWLLCVIPEAVFCKCSGLLLLHSAIMIDYLCCDTTLHILQYQIVWIWIHYYFNALQRYCNAQSHVVIIMVLLIKVGAARAQWLVHGLQINRWSNPMGFIWKLLINLGCP